MRNVCIIAIVLALTFTSVAALTLFQILDTNTHVMKSNEVYDSCKDASTNLRDSSDYLTSQSRMYVTTGDQRYLDNYIEELNTSTRRSDAVAELKSLPDNPDAGKTLQTALDMSNKLAETELHAMKLAAEAYDQSGALSASIEGELTANELALEPAEKVTEARSMLLDRTYEEFKSEIMHNVESSVVDIVEGFDRQRSFYEHQLNLLLMRMAVITGLLLILVIITIFTLYKFLMLPLNSYMGSIRSNEEIKPAGSYEMRYFGKAYNLIFNENMQRTEILRQAAEHDSLTGLYNRAPFDKFLETNPQNIALLIFDVDHFKSFNDMHGHNIGDAVLKKVASCISQSFRANDHAVRIGGDEFAVVMMETGPEMKEEIAAILENVRELLADRSDGMPEITLSVGVAFSDPEDQMGMIYRHADRALYLVKESGRNGYEFYVSTNQENEN